MMRLRYDTSPQVRRLLRRYPFLRRVSITTTLITLVWFYTVYWGERSVFKRHINACHWESWEEWPREAAPHHLVFIADPQLVDPHTYPGRPWPLSTLTEWYVDRYMSRNFRLINQDLDPDSIIFLGDLFDGGREWAPEKPKELKASQRQRLKDLGVLPREEGSSIDAYLSHMKRNIQESVEDIVSHVKRSMKTYSAALSRPHTHMVSKEDHNIGPNGEDLRAFTPGENGRWEKWGHAQWLKDFQRFSRIFFDPEQLYPTVPGRKLLPLYNVSADRTSIENGAKNGSWQEYATTGGKQRRVIASLPGNHDLGFGPGVQLVIRDRFESHFGEGNRVDVLGNHTIISIDAPSLAAHSHYRPDGYETDTEQDELKHIWHPGMAFLEGLYTPAKKMVSEVLEQYYPPEKKTSHRFTHRVVEPLELIEPPSVARELEFLNKKAELPVILLSHVPFYRNPDTECGRFREKNHAIPIQMGYQYQNVLTQSLSKDIIVKASEIGEVISIFSGDDHDYCDIYHRYNVNFDREDIIKTTLKHIREITVKSFSWAMGVRKPGFQMVSLWNPVDAHGQTVGTPLPTLQTQPCLLPDQLSIFIDYGLLLALTLPLLLGAAVISSLRGTDLDQIDEDPTSPLSASRMTLPRFQLNKDAGTNGFASAKQGAKATRQRGASTSSASHSRNNSALLGVQRSFNARTRSVSPNSGTPLPQTNGPLIDKAGFFPVVKWTDPEEVDDSDEESNVGGETDDSQAKWKWRRRVKVQAPSKVRRALEEFAITLGVVAVPVGLFYGVLIKNG